ncbi:MAG: GyrI-like domain-containing protein [bacterium]|nr:MAG: GyrI-like domain-containing protein [bacterium]
MVEQVWGGVEVGIKEAGPLRVACVSYSGPYEDIGRVLMDLFRWVLVNGGKVVSYPMVLFPPDDQGDPQEGVSFDACIPVQPDSPITGDAHVKITEIQAVTVAFTRHHGSFSTVGETYERIHAWIRDNGYRVAGRSRELYLTNPLEHSEEDLRTEIQIPIEAVRH